ncbi:recombinase family protein [Sphingobium sp.]|uniref:recombinase family protein n=1 Tax=Sphingobium sp. TaxID=1912891 RepID=UPI0025CF0BAC|nr:recombinase family protein [Sphingobium sp.]
MTEMTLTRSALKPAYIYARFSSAEQAKGFSLERQLSTARSFIESKGWHLAGEMTDEGRSAFHGSNRDEGAALFEFEAKARSGHFSNGAVLVVENIDRLSRQGPKAAAQLIWALNERGVDVATYHDDQIYRADASDMLEIFGLIIKASLAHEESEKKAKRAKASWDKKYAAIEAGSKKAITKNVPAWLTVTEDGDIQENKRRVAVVREIFESYAEGIGLHTIMKRLNGRGEPAFSGRDNSKGWSKSAINHVLSHRAVLGEFQTQNGKHIPVAYYPQIITLDLFNRVEAMRSTKTRTGGSSKYQGNNLFAGIARCEHCEGPMGFVRDGGLTRYTTASGEKKVYERKANHAYLICDAARRGFGCDNKTHASYSTIEAATLKQLLWVAIDDEQPSNPKADATQDKIDAVLHSLDLKHRQISNMLDSMIDTPSKAMAARVVALEGETETLQAELESLQKEHALLTAAPSTFNDIEELRVLADLLTSDDEDIRRAARLRTNAALKRVIDHMTVNRNGDFVVMADDIAVWEFNKQGHRIGGQAL